MYKIFNIKVTTGRTNNIVLMDKQTKKEANNIEHYREKASAFYKQKFKDKIIDGVIELNLSYKNYNDNRK